ncbi:MAG: tetratricopeptide repeat protein [Blastocatellia bacterium]|nr:tetratricopeptide repeat protein [Blastocatellia bacterium]
MTIVEEKIDQAKNLLIQKKPLEAEKTLRQAVEMDKTSATAQVELLRLLGLMKKWEDFDKFVEQAFNSFPDNADILTFRGIMLSRQDKLNEAIESYQKAVAINPELIMAYTNLGTALRDTERFSESEEALQKGLKYDPQNYHFHYELAQTLAYQMRIESSIYEVLETLKINPQYERAYLALARLYQQNNHIDQAINILKECIQRIPTCWEAVDMLKDFLLLKGDFQSAYNLWEQVIAQRGLMEDYLELGKICLVAGNVQRAEQIFQTAIKKNPRAWQPHCYLAELYDVSGLADKAIEKYKAAIKLNKNSYVPHNGLGVILLKKGDVAEAIRQFSQACKLVTADDPKPVYNLALALCKANKFAEAQGLLENFLSNFKTIPQDPFFDEMQKLFKSIKKELSKTTQV